ncbi:MAG: helix-turn-helix domain-containing protein [Xanthobacteraceae bacterium]|nr:helix-turn-helix domain-containing protein [Xanthobacteraceae bacterium]
MVDESEPKKFKLLTESEVAELLRCKPPKVKRLRLSGKLPYIPGRPNFILESDVLDYIQRERKIEAAGLPGSPEFQALQLQETQKRARESWMKYQFRLRRRNAAKAKT